MGHNPGMATAAAALHVAPSLDDGLALRYFPVTSADGTELAGVDQRRGRTDRAAVQRPGHQPLQLAGAARPRLRGARHLVEPPRHRRLRTPARPRGRRHRRLRRGRRRGDGRRGHRRVRADGLVDGREHDVRGGRRAPRAGHRPVRRRRRAGRHVLLDGCADPACPARCASRSRQRRADAQAGRPAPHGDRLPAADRPAHPTRCSATPASCCRCPTRSWPGGRSGSS